MSRLRGRSAGPELTVVIGANGAGKTTWTQQHRERLPVPFYNADSIAEGLGDANDAGLQRDARRIVDEAIERDLENRRSFGFESTYSGKSRPAIVERAARLGYCVRAVFIGTAHPDVNVHRVRKRVEEGGHLVQETEIIRRWSAARSNLIQSRHAFDRLTLIDSSGPEIRVVARTRDRILHPNEPVPAWARPILDAERVRRTRRLATEPTERTHDESGTAPL